MFIDPKESNSKELNKKKKLDFFMNHKTNRNI